MHTLYYSVASFSCPISVDINLYGLQCYVVRYGIPIELERKLSL